MFQPASSSSKLVLLLSVLAVPSYAAAWSVQEIGAKVQEIGEKVFSPENLHEYRFELLGLMCLAFYAMMYARGSAAIRKKAQTWVSFLWHPQGVLVRNFVSHPGTLEPGTRAWKESVTMYRSYASGRRYCQYALLTIDFKAQQDLFSQIWCLFSPRPDLLQVDVCMAEGCMPPTVLLLAQPKLIKGVVKEQPGVKDYAKTVSVARDRANGWADASKGWSVMAEHPSLLYDILNTEPAIARAFASKWFRYALISSEDLTDRDSSSSSDAAASSSSSSSSAAKEVGDKDGSGGSSSGPAKASRCQLRFVFGLPPDEQKEELNAMLAAVFLLVDLVGTYKMSPDLKKKATDLRTKLEQEAAKKVSASRQGHLAQKRSERLEADRARARAAGPQALAKFEERMQKQTQKREMRKRTVKM